MTNIAPKRSWGWVPLVLACCACLFCASSAAAAEPSPAWNLRVVSNPTNFQVEPTVEKIQRWQGYNILAMNVGGAPTSGPFVVTDTLPPGLEPSHVNSPEAFASSAKEIGSVSERLTCTVSGQTVSCEGSELVNPGESVSAFIPVEVTSAAPHQVVDEVEIFGGTAAGRRRTTTTTLEANPPPFGLLEGEAGFSTTVTGVDGSSALQAGAHPYQMSTTVGFPTELAPPGEAELYSVSEPKDVNVLLPRGLYVNPNASKVKCSEEELESAVTGESGSGCPFASQVGVVENNVRTLGPYEIQLPVPLYAMKAPPGDAAEFAFDAEAGVIVYVFGHVRSDGQYELGADVSNIPAKLQLTGSTLSFWGNPADPSHDVMRGSNGTAGCLGRSLAPGTCSVEPRNVPLITLPSDCSGQPLKSLAEADSWSDPGVFDHREIESTDLEGNPITVSGCNALEFKPTISAQATTNLADSPTGLDFNLHQPQNNDYEGLATANLKDATVTLPAGLTINPSSANGLGACTAAQIGLTTPIGQASRIRFSEGVPACPNAAKLGTVEATSPLLENKLQGAIYLAQPYQNPFGSLTAVYLQIEDEQTGIRVKLAGKITPNPQSGQLTATFSENPEQPLEDIGLHFFNGPRAALTTPLTCGTKTTTSDLTPWSTPEGADATPSDSFATSVAASGSGACPTTEAAAPNSPGFSAGTVAPSAGAFSPFVLKLTRPDGSQHITGISTTLPEGLLGKLAGISYCPEGGIALARSREAPEQGKVEQASPSCPAASEVGTVTVGAGSGPTPFYVGGHVYLAGTYNGAALSLVIITPAVAGPFDLGNVVTRVALNVDPYTAQINAVSDPLPTILQGIPLDIRSIALKLDRTGFTLNPTSCEVKSITGAATTQTGQVAPLTNRFQVGDCSRLAFKPTLSLSLKGATKRNGFPALKAVVTYPKKGSFANIAKAQVGLPHSEFLEQGNLNKVCTQIELKTRTCPISSIYGKAKVWTPLLDKPLEGPVYLGVGFGHKLPDLVAELDGQLRVLLHGRIDTDKKGGIRNSFETVPDAPVSKFILELKGGKKKGLLVNSENICRKTQTAEAAFTAQNGKVLNLTPKIANSCGGKGKAKKHKKGKSGTAGKHRK